MSEAPLSPQHVQERIIDLLAEGNGPTAISKKLRTEGLAEVTHSAVHQHIAKVLNDPKMVAILTLRQRAVMVANAAELSQVAWEVTDKIRTALKHVNINDEVLEIKDVKLLMSLTPLLNTWWRNLAEINDMLKKEQVNLNLTQVNIEQVSSINSQLLSVIQDVLNKLPATDRANILDRIAELSSQEPIETTAREKQE